jgi:hypothetical protein
MAQKWKVGAVGSMGRGFGFSIQNRYSAPLLSVAYETEEEAERARRGVIEAIGDPTDLQSHPEPGRMPGT